LQRLNNFFERGALTTKRLGLFGIVPDFGVFELAPDLGQAFGFALIVKGTPSALRSAPGDP
jgi:hypothetical protein